MLLAKRDVNKVLMFCTGPLRYAPALLFPLTALASVVGASWGHEGVHAVVSMLPASQVLSHAVRAATAVCELLQSLCVRSARSRHTLST